MKISSMKQIHFARAAGAALLLIGMFVLSACGGKNRDIVTGQYYHPGMNGSGNEAVEAGTESAQSTEGASEKLPESINSSLFLIMANDMQSECLILEQLASGKQYMYYYSMATRFLDKYGGRAAVSSFDPGRIITIGEKDSKGRVKEVQISDAV